MIYNAELCSSSFSVNISVLAVVFRRQILKNRTILPEIVRFLKTVGEIQQLVWKSSQKINYDKLLHYISIPIYPMYCPKFCLIQKQ